MDKEREKSLAAEAKLLYTDTWLGLDCLNRSCCPLFSLSPGIELVGLFRPWRCVIIDDLDIFH